MEQVEDTPGTMQIRGMLSYFQYYCDEIIPTKSVGGLFIGACAGGGGNHIPI